MNTKLNKITEDLFAEFADSSIDSDEFYSFIKSYKFKELLENYFYTLRDGMGGKEYKENLIKLAYLFKLNKDKNGNKRQEKASGTEALPLTDIILKRVN